VVAVRATAAWKRLRQRRRRRRRRRRNTGLTSVLRRMEAAAMAAAGARVGSRRLRCWIARRALKMQARTFADASQERRAPMNDEKFA
jgi:hypothetical protein